MNIEENKFLVIQIDNEINYLNSKLEDLENDSFLTDKNIAMFDRLYKKHKGIKSKQNQKKLNLLSGKIGLMLSKQILNDQLNDEGNSSIDEDYLNDILNEYIFYRK